MKSYRMNILNGSQATLHRDFDVNFVGLEEGNT